MNRSTISLGAFSESQSGWIIPGFDLCVALPGRWPQVTFRQN